MNFFKLYIGDYQRDTAHLSVTEHGAFLLMLQHYYATEKPLPTGKALHRMLRAQDKAERDAIDAVVAQFWTETPEGLANGRADDEITKANAQADTNRAIAQAREAKRKAARSEHEQSTNRATNGQPNQTPDTRQIPSVPDGTGAGAPPDPADVIFGLGVPLLTAASVAERNARSMLGLMRKQHGDAATIDALRRCAAEKPLQPVPWLQAALKAKAAPNKRQAVEDDNRNIALAWANGEAR